MMLAGVLAVAGLLPLAIDTGASSDRAPPGATAAPTPDQAPMLSRGTGPLSAEERARRDAVVQALREAEADATERPEMAESALRRALEDFSDIAPLVADDEDAQSARIHAQLALARTLLAIEQPEAAAAALNRALREAHGEALPVARFGPSLTALAEERRAAIAKAGSGTLEVDCTVPCAVFVDAHPFGPARSLPAGSHRLWIESQTAGQPVTRRAFDLHADKRLVITYDPPPPPPQLPPPGPDRRVDRGAGAGAGTSPRRPRILPRWLAGVGIGTGVGLVGAGAALVAVDHRCPDLSDPRQVPCLRILNTNAGGWTLVGLGGALAITSAVLLTVDEVRHRRHQRRPRSSRARHARRR